jgi:integrase
LRTGILPKDDGITVAELMGNYMENVARHNVRPKTFETYQYLLKMHILPTIGKVKLTQLRADHLQALYSQKLEAGLSKRTVQFMHSVIHKALTPALKWNMVVRNVADVADSPRSAKRSPTIWTPEQVKSCLECAKDSKYYLVYLLAVFCGFRKSEVLGIHLKDIDLKRGTISVNHTVQISKQGVYLADPKTDSSRRSVTMPAAPLKEYMGRLKR